MAPSSTPHRADAQANRSRLIQAARAVFAERGLSAEMKEVAERAGVGIGTIYRNFANKDELIDALIRDRVAAALERIIATRRIPDPAARLRAVLDIAYDCAEEDGQLIVRLASHAYNAVPPPEILAEIAGLLQHGQEMGAFRREVDPAVFGLFIASQLDAYLAVRRILDPAAASQALADLVLHAVLAPVSVR